MQNTVSKIVPALGLSLVAFTSAINADNMQSNTQAAAPMMNNMACVQVNPPLRDGADIWVQGEALYMQATEDNLEVAFKVPSTETILDGSARHASYDWDWGFRLGLGANIDHDGWDFLLNWTRFHSSRHRHIETDSDDALVATVNQQFSGPAGGVDAGALVASEVTAHTKLHINLLDLEMGREMYLSKYLSLRPFVGLRGAVITRHMDVNYEGGSATSSLSGDVELTSTESLEDSFRNQYHGLGLRAGFDTQWNFATDWSFYTDMAISLLYGRAKLNSDEDYSTSSSTTEELDAKNGWNSTRAITDLALGIRWDQFFSEQRYRLRLQLGWENHLFFNFTKDMDFTSSVNAGKFTMRAGDLGLNGLAFQARFDF